MKTYVTLYKTHGGRQSFDKSSKKAEDAIHKRFSRNLEQEMPALAAYAVKLSGGASWSDDLAQETLLRAIDLKDDFKPGTNLRAWLFTIMKNIYLNEARKLSRRRSVSLEEIQPEARTSTPASQEHHLSVVQVLAAFRKLPPSQQSIIQLVVIDGLSYAETSLRIAKPVGTVRSRLSRARKSLKRALE